MFNPTSLTLEVFDLVAAALVVEPTETQPEKLIAGTIGATESEQTAAVLLDAIIQANEGVKPKIGFADASTNHTWLDWEQADKGTRSAERLNRIMLYDLMDSLNILPAHPDAVAPGPSETDKVAEPTPA